jgi:hypothetical protein
MGFFILLIDIYMNNMKNDKKLKEIIKECIKEILKENEGYKLTQQERTKINNKFHSKGELGGNIKLDKKEKALTTINLILNEFGFELDMVTGDILMGEKGGRLLTFRKKTSGEDPFSEGPEVINSKISFNWENMERPQMESNKFPRWEVVAYVT